MAYLTYAEYTSMGGELSELDFSREEFVARKRIDRATFGRVQAMETVPDAVKQCMMTLIKVLGRFGAEAQADSPLVASFSTDGYSESYGSASEQTQTAEAAMDEQIGVLLYGENDDNGVPLLYRGVDL